MDMTETTIPKSDQMNADDLDSGPRTFTVKEVRRASSAEQPVDIVLAEFPAGRPFKPSKSMRRVMIAAWGKETDVYVGRRMTLYRDPTITFGPDAVGGIRISHMSDLPGNKRLVMPLTVTRGKREPYRVEPLPDDAPNSPPMDETAVKVEALQREWHTATPERKADIEAEVAVLRNEPETAATP